MRRETGGLDLADAVARATVGLCIVDSQGRVAWVNEILQRFFGLSGADLLGLSQEEWIEIRCMVRPMDAQLFRKAMVEAYEQPSGDPRKCYIKRGRRRKERWLEVSVLRIESGPYKAGWLETYVDVTAHTKNRMEPASKTVHEFNNLLTAILSHSVRLQASLGESSPHMAAVREIRKAAERAAALTRRSPMARAVRTPAEGGAETVLLVDDEEIVRRLARQVLDETGYTVLEAADAHEALEIARGHEGEIDLVLTDVVMPHMSGRELARRLHIRRPETKVLFMSDYPERAMTTDDRGTAMGPLLEKPFTPEGLKRRVRDALT